MVRTGSLRTQSARHRVDHGTICGRSCANSGHYKPLRACVHRTFVNPNSSRRRPEKIGKTVRVLWSTARQGTEGRARIKRAGIAEGHIAFAPVRMTRLHQELRHARGDHDGGVRPRVQPAGRWQKRVKMVMTRSRRYVVASRGRASPASGRGALLIRLLRDESDKAP